MIAELASALADTAFARFARGEAYLVAASLHIFGVALTIGPVFLADLRAFGLFSALPFSATLHAASRLAQIGFLVAATSGGLLFAAKPEELAFNPMFVAKLIVMAIGLCNALIFLHLLREVHAPSKQLFVTAGVSMICWTMAIVFGVLVPYAT